jgi:hypothetical protein
MLNIENIEINTDKPKQIMGLTPEVYYLLVAVLVFSALGLLIVYLQKTQLV